MIRVGHVTTVDITARFLLLEQLRRLRDEGYEVAAISAPGRWTGDLEAEGIRHIPWPHATRSWAPAEDARAFRALVRILRRERFHIVHTHNPKPGVMGRLAARLAGVRCVVNTVHGFYATPDDPPARRVPIMLAERIAARLSDLEFYQSEEDFEWARRGIVDPSKAVLLGNGTNVEFFDPHEVPSERLAQLRDEFGIRANEVVVGTIGRLVTEKGYAEFFEAAREVRAAVPESRFLAVGPRDPAKADALGGRQLRGVGEDVIVTGFREDVRDLLALMDVFVLASWREGMPRSAIEAAAMGRAMVLTDIRGCREVATDGIEALLVRPRDPRGLATAILRLVRDPVLRQRMGAAARLRAVERFDEKAVADRVLSAYADLLEAKGLRWTSSSH